MPVCTSANCNNYQTQLRTLSPHTLSHTHHIHSHTLTTHTLTHSPHTHSPHTHSPHTHSPHTLSHTHTPHITTMHAQYICHVCWLPQSLATHVHRERKTATSEELTIHCPWQAVSWSWKRLCLWSNAWPLNSCTSLVPELLPRATATAAFSQNCHKVGN